MLKIDVNQVEGYAYGAIQPSITLRFSDGLIDDRKLRENCNKLREQLPTFNANQRFFAGDIAFDQATAQALLVTILDTLNDYCGDQRFTPIHVFEEENSLCFSLPTLSTQMSLLNMNAIQPMLKMASNGILSKEIIGFLEKQKRLARQFLPAGTNAGSFIAAAAERKIPFKIFNRRYIIFGYGIGSRIFNSSITDEESAIGVSLAKSKVDTNRLLKMSGIPVTEQARVRTVDDAIRFARTTDYPVVLKPEAEEQGRGVFANIINETELKQCFKKASKHYKALIIEKFIKGFSYRVHLHYGKVVGAWKMMPPCISGDGNSSISELIDIENARPERKSINSSLKPIPKDYVTELNLKKLGLTFNFCPSLGEEIVLAATSNESRGGAPQNFLSSLHPEILDLCIQASHTLQLKVAGIDIISEDAAVSWRENNAAICEINSQPQLGDLETYSHLFHDLLNRIPEKQPEVSLVVSNKFENFSLNLFNKTVREIVVEVSPHYLHKFGSPTQFFDKLSFEGDVSIEDQEMITSRISSTPCTVS